MVMWVCVTVVFFVFFIWLRLVTIKAECEKTREQVEKGFRELKETIEDWRKELDFDLARIEQRLEEMQEDVDPDL
jgi:hypothetical protein